MIVLFSPCISKFGAVVSTARVNLASSYLTSSSRPSVILFAIVETMTSSSFATAAFSFCFVFDVTAFVVVGFPVPFDSSDCRRRVLFFVQFPRDASTS